MSEKYFSRKENLNKYTSFEDQEGTRYIWENVLLALLCSTKAIIYTRLYTSKRVTCFYACKIFYLKKINSLKFVLIVHFTILLTCISLNSPIENLFVRTYFYLWESFFSWSLVKIFFFIKLSQYFALTSKHKPKILILLEKAITILSVRTYSHLLFIIQNLFWFVCIHIGQ